MRPHGTPEQLEQRRREAVALREQGVGPTEIARRLNTTPQSVCQWVKAHRRGGEAALAAKPSSGRPPKLSTRQRRGLAGCLLRDATTLGFATNLWTCPRVAQLIEQRYGVRYHVDAIPRLLASLGFSPSEARASRRRA